MLTAKVEETDKITGLTLGADDYHHKTLPSAGAGSPVKASAAPLHQYNPAKAAEETEADVLALPGSDAESRHPRVPGGQQARLLTPTEFSILRILLEQRGKVVSAEALFHAIWADEYYCKSSNTISVHVRHLREKLGDTAEHSKYIKTVWGGGIKLNGKRINGREYQRLLNAVAPILGLLLGSMALVIGARICFRGHFADTIVNTYCLLTGQSWSVGQEFYWYQVQNNLVYIIIAVIVIAFLIMPGWP